MCATPGEGRRSIFRSDSFKPTTPKNALPRIIMLCQLFPLIMLRLPTSKIHFHERST